MPLLTRIDDLLRPDHSYLLASDECYALREYTAGGGFSFSESNDLLLNFKKPLDRRGRPEWRYKEEAIARLAKELRAAINPRWLSVATLVPIPPSHAKGDPRHDDRMLRLLGAVAPSNADIRELIVLARSRPAAHGAKARPTPRQHMGTMAIDESVTRPAPVQLGIFDDLLVTGSSFRAASDLLAGRFPGVPVVGIFLARRPIQGAATP